MRAESACKSAAEHAQHKTPDFLHYCAHLSRLCCPEQPLKTALECINHEKTLTVREALFRRESVPLSMHGCMESMAIKQHTFCACPWTAAHFCGASTHIGLLEEPKARARGHLRRTGADVDLGARLAASSDNNLSKMRGSRSVRSPRSDSISISSHPFLREILPLSFTVKRKKKSLCETNAKTYSNITC